MFHRKVLLRIRFVKFHEFFFTKHLRLSVFEDTRMTSFPFMNLATTQSNYTEIRKLNKMKSITLSESIATEIVHKKHELAGQ